MLSRYIFFWFVLAVIAIGNGILREATYGRSMSDLSAHQLSTVTGILLSGIAVWLVMRIWPLDTAQQAWTIGIAWLLMTVTFEFTFGHFVAGHSWRHLLADYKLFDGRIWLLFLVWVTVMPYFFFRIR